MIINDESNFFLLVKEDVWYTGLPAW
jgi:hypothetical protein